MPVNRQKLGFLSVRPSVIYGRRPKPRFDMNISRDHSRIPPAALGIRNRELSFLSSRVVVFRHNDTNNNNHNNNNDNSNSDNNDNDNDNDNMVLRKKRHFEFLQFLHLYDFTAGAFKIQNRIIV